MNRLTIILSLSALIGIALFHVRKLTQPVDDSTDEGADGDWPFIPDHCGIVEVDPDDFTARPGWVPFHERGDTM